MKISAVALSALAALTLSCCNEPQPKENGGEKRPAIDSVATVNTDSLTVNDDYCPPCGRG